MNKTLSMLCLLLALVQAFPARAASVFVRVQTNLGAFTMELDSGKAPISVANFLAYLNSGFYKDTVFHRSPKNFVVQGGGYDLNLVQKTTLDPIVLESTNVTGLSNVRGSVAMARTNVFDSGTSQFFVNVVDNIVNTINNLDYKSAGSPGYAVFGKIVEGMETIDAINALPVYNVRDKNGALLTDFPNLNPQFLEPVYIQDAVLLPTADAGQDFSVRSGAIATLDGSASSDPTPGQTAPLGYRWTQIAGPPIQFIGETNTARPTFTAPSVAANTVLSFELVVTNASGNASINTALVNVTVKAKNNPPVADPGPGGTLRAGATLNLDGSGSYDPDNDPGLTFAWTAPGGLVLANANTPRPSLTVPANAFGRPLAFSLTVSDGKLSDTKTVTYDIVDNGPPVVAVASRTVREGEQVILTSTASDPENDGLAYRWEQIDGMPVNPDGNDGPSLSFTAPMVTGTAELQFRLTVTDGYAAAPKSAAATTRVTVNDDTGLLDCSGATPSRTSLWPANGGLVPVAITGITPAGGYDLIVTRVDSDEPVRDKAAKDNTAPDAQFRKGKITRKQAHRIDTVLLRAERQFKGKSGAGSGNGRVYTVKFTAQDGARRCTGAVQIGVPPKKGQAAVDDGFRHDALKRR